MADMSVNALRNNLTNIARSFWYDIIFASPIGGGDSTAMEARCVSTSLPGRGVGTIKVPYKASPGVKFPGKITMGQTWPVTFVEGTDKAIFDALYGWSEAIRSAQFGTGGDDSDIKSDILVLPHDQNGDPWLKIKLVGAYVENIPDVSISWDSEAEVRFSCTFSYDYWVEVD